MSYVERRQAADSTSYFCFYDHFIIIIATYCDAMELFKMKNLLLDTQAHHTRAIPTE